jgi:hypothetical protein
MAIGVIAALLPTVPAPASAQPLAAAVLPASRSVQVGTAATVFASVINAGTVSATGCTIAVITSIPASFRYFTTNPTTNAVIGGPNPTVTIGPGTFQTFLLEFTPTGPFGPTDVQLRFDCGNTDPAPITSGLNTVLLSASTTPVPDIVALAATLSNDGIVTLNSVGVFAVASVNVGATGTLTASAAAATAGLPVSFTLCRTNPNTAACLQPPTASVTTTIASNETPTFSIFVNGSAFIPFLPGVNRVVLRFRDSGNTTRGSTSVAVRSGSLSGNWRVTVRGTAHFDTGEVEPLVPATLEGRVTQQNSALSGTLLADNIRDIVGILPPGCSLTCPTPGTCILNCTGLLSCTLSCTPATANCAERFDLIGTGTESSTLAFEVHGGGLVQGSCSGQASGTLFVQDTTTITLSGSPITLTGTHSGRVDRSCGGTGDFAGAVECPDFSFSGTFDQSIQTPPGSVAAGEGERTSGRLWGAITRALQRLVSP